MEDVLTSARMTSFERRSVALSGVTKRRKVQSDSHSECSKCRRVLPKAEFWKDARAASGVQGACKACKSGQFKSWTSTWNGKLCSLVHHAHHSHAVRSKRREMGGELEVTASTLIERLETQQFRCYYSGHPLTTENVSLERINPSITYTPSNVALIRHHFQTSRQWTVEKFAAVPSLRKDETYDEEMVESAFVWQAWSEEKLSDTSVYSRRTDETEWTLHRNTHDAAKERGVWASNVSHVCLGKLNSTGGCVFRKATGWSPPPIPSPPSLVPFCQRMLANSKSSTKHRNRKRLRRGKPLLADPTITTRDIMNMYRQQRGKCAYLGIPMLLAHGDDNNWTCSLERTDRDKGYSVDNCVLVVEEVNDAEQWSRSDADMYWPE